MRKTSLGVIYPDDIFPALLNYRFCWCMGRLRSGKTALAFRLASHFLAQGYKLFSNVRSVWSDDMSNIESRYVGVFDEGGVWIERHDVKGLFAGLGKADGVLIVPSVIPPPPMLRGFRVDRVLSGYKFGLPFWMYRWWMPGEKENEGSNFLWINPHHLWGVYDTVYLSVDDGGYKRLRDSIVRRLSGGKSLERNDAAVMEQLAELLRDKADVEN